MRKTVNLLGWSCVFFTILATIFTLLSTYQFIYIKYFDNYHTLQWGLFLTLIFLGIKMFNFKDNIKGFKYSFLCIVMAVGVAFFILIDVY